jgi:hypothetical protein
VTAEYAPLSGNSHLWHETMRGSALQADSASTAGPRLSLTRDDRGHTSLMVTRLSLHSTEDEPPSADGTEACLEWTVGLEQTSLRQCHSNPSIDSLKFAQK